LLVTVVTDHTVRIFPGNTLLPAALKDFTGQVNEFGEYGQEKGQLMFPNSAVVDSQKRTYVTDGNNGRVSMWDAKSNFLLSFGRGTGDEALNLPRGAWLDNKDRLHIVDAVGHTVRVYNVSGTTPVFLYTFGDLGSEDGLFNYPNDICMDGSGYLFIVDRENNRVQVWSY
jgi:tripartite motif-containing protein 71